MRKSAFPAYEPVVLHARNRPTIPEDVPARSPRERLPPARPSVPQPAHDAPAPLSYIFVE